MRVISSYTVSQDIQSDENAYRGEDGDSTTLVYSGNETNDEEKDKTIDEDNDEHEHDAFVDDEVDDNPHRRNKMRRRWCWCSKTISTCSCGIGCIVLVVVVVVVVVVLVVGSSIRIISNYNPTLFHKHNQSSTDEIPYSGPRHRCSESSFDANRLKDPCSFSNQQAPDVFELIWPTNQYGKFSMNCVRQRAPVQVDRVYNLARYGYYNYNYFLRVIPNKYVQFGTNGLPAISNVYNWSSMPSFLPPSSEIECQSSIIFPQPPEMQRCMSNKNLSLDCHSTDSSPAATTTAETQKSPEAVGLSNTFGTVSMSTSYNETYKSKYGDFAKYGGVTWNATAELFINIGHNNQHLDHNLFVPICTIDHPKEMDDVVLKFPSFGELSDFGGGEDGPSLGLLYEHGNKYIESNPVWNQSMAQSTRITICE